MSATLIKFPLKKHRRLRLTKPQQKRVRWIAEVLRDGGVPVSEAEVEAACSCFYCGCLPFSHRYGQDLKHDCLVGL
jgi:hypothetical protein